MNSTLLKYGLLSGAVYFCCMAKYHSAFYVLQ